MPVNLQKGQKVSLSKSAPGLTKVVVGLGWDVNQFDTGGDFDLDAAAFLLGDSGKAASSSDFVFYGNLKHSSGGVEHLGDNLTGAGDGDDEQIKVDLAKLPPSVTHVAFTATIYDAETRRQNFGMVSNAFIRIYNEDTGEELLATVLQRYKDIGVWNTDPVMSEAAFERLQMVMQQAGELAKPAPYEQVVNNTFAQAVKE